MAFSWLLPVGLVLCVAGICWLALWDERRLTAREDAWLAENCCHDCGEPIADGEPWCWWGNQTHEDGARGDRLHPWCCSVCSTERGRVDA